MATETISSKLTAGDLSNPIHPVFNGTFPNNADMKVLDMPLRLASRFLRCDSLKSFLGNIIVEYDSTCESTIVALDNNKEVDPINSILKCLGQIVSFVPQIKGVPELEDANFAVTVRDSTKTHRVFPNGCGSTIGYITANYNRLSEATKTSSADLPLLLWNQFTFAVTLVHELCHALMKALQGADEYEPFFGENATTEIWFECEAHLFGGLIFCLFDGEGSKREVIRRYKLPGGRKSQMRGLILLAEWSSCGMTNAYKTKRLSMEVRDDNESTTQDRMWRVPLTFIQQFFTNSYWDNHVPRHGVAALRLEKTVGHFFTVDMNGHGEPEWSVTSRSSAIPNPIPNGYIINEYGELKPRTTD